MDKHKIPKENEIFQIIVIDNYRFELKYGYYVDSDRNNSDPVPIYPDFENNPVYTRHGYPLVTAIQVPCEYYTPSEGYEDEECCSCCIHYPNMIDEISICQCEEKRLKTTMPYVPFVKGGAE